MNIDNISKKYGLDTILATGSRSLFEYKINDVKNMLEIKNNKISDVTDSLKYWSNYFPCARIFAINNNGDTSSNIFVADQSNHGDLQKVMDTIETKLDVIIDNGSHLVTHKVIAFTFLEKFLNNGGIYVIEDIQSDKIESFRDLSVFPQTFVEHLKNKYNFSTYTKNHQEFMMSFTRKIEFKVNDSVLVHDAKWGIVDDLYQKVVGLCKDILIKNTNIKVNLSLCNNSYIFDNDNKTIRLNINYEHTLVKVGGRTVAPGTPFGTVLDDDGNKYLVRIFSHTDVNELHQADIIIDYCITNIYNVKTCPLFEYFSKKHIYISSTFYETCFEKGNRPIETLTTFIYTNEPRRRYFLSRVDNTHINVNNCFVKEELQQLYKNTKVLINIYQTDHHHTFSELRVLPALQCGVICVCEKTPLSDLLEYNDCIIWETYDKIIEKSREVLQNYDYYHQLIFTEERRVRIENFKQKDYEVLQEQIFKSLKNIN